MINIKYLFNRPYENICTFSKANFHSTKKCSAYETLPKKKKNQQAVFTKFETIILGVMFYIYHSNDLFWKIFSLENETWKGLKCFPVLSCLEFSTRITNKKSKTNFRIV